MDKIGYLSLELLEAASAMLKASEEKDVKECEENSKMFFYKRFTTKYFDWHFGYIPYSNPSRKGRMVWFTEDIDKIGK